jgi:prevent-host-death family protein
MKKTTITQARENLPALWDEIEKTKLPVIISRRGHEDMALLPAASLERMQDELVAPVHSLLGTDIALHPERLQGFPAGLLARMKSLTTDVPINHDEEIESDGSEPQWDLSQAEMVELLRILAGPKVATPAFTQATAEAERLFGTSDDVQPARM